MSSAVAFIIALYSASVLDLETVGCFLADHEMRLEPKKRVKPPVDLRSSKQPAQSTSEKALKRQDEDLRILIPTEIVPLMYWRIPVYSCGRL
jgi:hypothetical protein